MRSLLLLPILFALTACSLFEKPGCFIQDQAVSLSSGVIVSELQCSNGAAVQADVKKIVEGLGLCKQSPTGLIGEIVCPSVAAGILLSLKNTIPSAWGCTAQNATDKLSQALIDACKKIPVSK